ncbi:MAG: Ger(x)C family spore germination protein [Christensenellales bacterium]|jgi:spore germination protein KC
MKKNKHLIRLTALLMLPLLLLLFCGCWDSVELNQIFLVTGIGLDLSEQGDKLDIIIQIIDIKSKGSGGGGKGESKEPEVILIKNTNNTVHEAIVEINRNSERQLTLHHIQVLAIGKELAEHGIAVHLDMFVRNLQTRLETPVVVVDGKAEELISAELAQEANSGIYMKGMFETLFKISPKVRERLIDTIHCFTSKTRQPLIPMVKVKGEKGKQEVELTGMAVFKDEKMIDALDIPLTEGYVWAMGDVKKDSLNVIEGEDVAVFQINQLKTKQKIKVTPEGKVSVTLDLQAQLSIRELKGYVGIKPDKLVEHLIRIAQKQIGTQIDTAYLKAKELGADFFGFGTALEQSEPRKFKTMEKNWEQVFKEIDLTVKTTVMLESAGLIIQPVEIGGSDSGS